MNTVKQQPVYLGATMNALINAVDSAMQAQSAS